MSRRKPVTFAEPPKGARALWRSLDEKADPEKYRQEASREFPEGVIEGRALIDSKTDLNAAVGPDLTRRGFMQLAGATAALVGLEGCVRRPVENIVPFAKQPEYVLPGNALHYATVTQVRGEALGLLVETHEGRPTKIEGNPEHPASLGATDKHTQAMTMDLYDPDRSTAPAQRQGEKLADASWADFDRFAAAQLGQAGDGEGVRVLLQPSNSPSLLRVRGELLKKLPKARVHVWEPVHEGETREATRLAFGQPLVPVYRFDSARVIVSLDSDFLGSEPGFVLNTRRFADGRRIDKPTDEISRLYVVEPQLTVTGGNADHRLRLPAQDIARYAQVLAKAVGSALGGESALGALGPALAKADAAGIPAKWVQAVAADLVRNRGKCLVVAGTRQPAAVQALAFALNQALGNVDQTLSFQRPADAEQTDPVASIRELTTDLSAGKVKALWILGGNPVLDAPADLGFAVALAKAPVSVHLSSHRDETSKLAGWHLPRTHELEAWGDQQAFDGTLSVQQPLLEPLHGGRSDLELLAQLAGIAKWRGHELVRETLRANVPSVAGFDNVWRKTLHLGLMAGTKGAPVSGLSLQGSQLADAVGKLPAPAVLGPENLELAFAPDPKLHDGRQANNPWLLELPDPITKICWDNAVTLSPATAKQLGVKDGELVRLTRGGKSVEILAWTVPGQADFSLGVTLGWGRENPGRYGKGYGFDVYPLRASDALGFGSGVKLEPLHTKHFVAQTQEHGSMEGRPVAVEATVAEYRDQPHFAQFASPTPSTLPLWKEFVYDKYKWAMSIDLNACTGCNACAIACTVENNVAVVGKEQVARGREMHWMRIDRYFVGDDAESPDVAFQPVACVQCEEAPCENVCPVNATAHSPEGLNDMAYNRCIGTRYCANNCPYKVRRFNYLDFHGDVPETVKMSFNPNVTVRMRGVMEKCSYCVQRIQAAKIVAKREDRTVQDGEVVTACAQACPAQAITFGDLNDPNAKVAQLVKRDRQYKLLAEIGTQPRTTYLAKIRNPNPEMHG